MLGLGYANYQLSSSAQRDGCSRAAIFKSQKGIPGRHTTRTTVCPIDSYSAVLGGKRCNDALVVYYNLFRSYVFQSSTTSVAIPDCHQGCTTNFPVVLNVAKVHLPSSLKVRSNGNNAMGGQDCSRAWRLGALFENKAPFFSRECLGRTILLFLPTRESFKPCWKGTQRQHHHKEREASFWRQQQRATAPLLHLRERWKSRPRCERRPWRRTRHWENEIYFLFVYLMRLLCLSINTRRKILCHSFSDFAVKVVPTMRLFWSPRLCHLSLFLRGTECLLLQHYSKCPYTNSQGRSRSLLAPSSNLR